MGGSNKFYAPLDWYDPYYTPAPAPFYSPSFSQIKSGRRDLKPIDPWTKPSLKAPSFAESLFERGVDASKNAGGMLEIPLGVMNMPYEFAAQFAEPHLKTLADLTPFSQSTKDKAVQGTLLAAMIAAPGPGGKSKAAAKAARLASKAENAAARGAKAAALKENRTLASIIRESRVPKPLDPAAGVMPVNPVRGLPDLTGVETRSRYVIDPITKELKQVPLARTSAPSISGDAIPDVRRMTEGPVKREVLEPAARAVSRPSMPYVRQELRSAGYAPDPFAPKRLPEYGTGWTGDLPPLTVNGKTRPMTEGLPPLALDEFAPAPKPKSFMDYLLGGRKEPIVPNASNPKLASGQRIYRQIWDEMAADSPAGQKMAELMQTTRLQGDNLAGTWKAESRAIRKPIENDPEKWDAFVKALDEGKPLPPHLENDAALKTAVDWHRNLFRFTASEAKATGMGFKTKGGKLIPFEGRGDYFPHIYPKEFFSDIENQAAAIASKYGVDTNEARNIIMRAQEHGGMLIPETDAARAAIAKYGERYISPQHSRELVDFGGWRTDPGAIDTHLTNMAHRITEARNYGAMDIGEIGTPLHNLLSQTKNDALVRNLAERVLKREAPPGYIGSQSAKASSAIAKGMAATHLSWFPVSNAQQAAAIPLRAGLGPTLKAAGRKLTDRAGVKLRAFKSGALETADTDALQEMGGQSRINKLFGISRSEKTVRSLANEAGQIHVQDLFSELKRNPKSDKVRNKIEELTRTPAEKLLAQEKLTQQQLDLAGSRMAEITQGRAQAGDLPYHWSSGPGMNVVLMFKKYGYRQAHTMMNAIKENPAKNIPLALFGFGAAGEITGDIKAGIKGGIKGGIKSITDMDFTGAPVNVVAGAWDEIKKRGDWIKTAHPGLSRMVDNYAQSWLLGLPGDALQALSRGRSDILDLIAGPAIGLGAEVGAGLGKAALSGDLAPLTYTAARRLPWIGTGVASTIKDSKKKPKKSGTRRRY